MSESPRTRRTAYFSVTPEWILEMVSMFVNIPPACKLQRLSIDPMTDSVCVFIEDPSFSEVHEGEVPPQIAFRSMRVDESMLTAMRAVVRLMGAR